ncbi:MAG: ABC transporter ATP-binding protein [Anaerovoracaceae bacterium]|jgi:putative ABC transport system ATP-binding protein
MSILQIENLTFSYNQASVEIFHDLNLTFEAGRVYAIRGRSGAGKTTLLSLLSALVKPSGGRILVRGNDISRMYTYRYRCSEVGIVFQSYNLFPKMDAVENVVLSMDISGHRYADKKAAATDLLKSMGLDEQDLERPVLKLSGGQQQRVAIARALSYEPAILLADEPTGNLDKDTEHEIMNLFREQAHEKNKCVIIVTHSDSVAGAADKVIDLQALTN